MMTYQCDKCGKPFTIVRSDPDFPDTDQLVPETYGPYCPYCGKKDDVVFVRED